MSGAENFGGGFHEWDVAAGYAARPSVVRFCRRVREQSDAKGHRRLLDCGRGHDRSGSAGTAAAAGDRGCTDRAPETAGGQAVSGTDTGTQRVAPRRAAKEKAAAAALAKQQAEAEAKKQAAQQDPYADPAAPYKANRLESGKFSEPIANTPRSITVLTQEVSKRLAAPRPASRSGPEKAATLSATV